MKALHSDIGKVRVLVYGTLKKDHTNHALMERIRAKFIGYDSIKGAFKLRDLGPFPAIFDLTDKEIKDNLDLDGTVRGEVYMMDEEALAHLDFYEGHPNFFVRRKLWTEGMKKRVWVYFQTIQEFNDMSNTQNVCDNGMWQARDAERDYWLDKDIPF